MKLTLMTWSLENLFPAGTPGGPATDADYRAKLHNLATTITQLAPDILAVQEVGSPEAFHDLQHALGGAYPHGELSKAPDGRGIRVGFLSKRRLEHAEDIVDFAANATVAVREEDGTPDTRMRRGAARCACAPPSTGSRSTSSRCTSNPSCSRMPIRLLLSTIVFAMSRAAVGDKAFFSTRRASSSRQHMTETASCSQLSRRRRSLNT
jgi:hypothetical protein